MILFSENNTTCMWHVHSGCEGMVCAHSTVTWICDGIVKSSQAWLLQGYADIAPGVWRTLYNTVYYTIHTVYAVYADISREVWWTVLTNQTVPAH